MQKLMLVSILWFVIPCTIWAQIESGPAAGTKLEAFKASVVTGDQAGNDIELGQGQKDKQVIYIWVNQERWERPIARFIRQLDEEIDKSAKDIQIYMIWLTDQVDEVKDYLPKVQQALKLKKTNLTIFCGDKQGPLAWLINADAHLTVVIAKGDKATKSLAFRSTNETDVKKVLEQLKKN